MQLTLVIVIVLAIAALFLYLASKLILNRAWVIGWLKGMAGLTLAFFAVMGFLAVTDIYTYRNAIEEETIATISFEKVSNQTYKASLLTKGSKEQEYELKGDQWQWDVRLLSWDGPLAAAGVMPAYRLDRLSGRYLSLEQERSSERTVHSISESVAYDFWQLAQSMPWFDAKYGSATFLPMIDGGIFEVKLTARGVLGRPLNDVAKAEMSRW